MNIVTKNHKTIFEQEEIDYEYLNKSIKKGISFDSYCENSECHTCPFDKYCSYAIDCERAYRDMLFNGLSFEEWFRG